MDESIAKELTTVEKLSNLIQQIRENQQKTEKTESNESDESGLCPNINNYNNVAEMVKIKKIDGNVKRSLFNRRASIEAIKTIRQMKTEDNMISEVVCDTDYFHEDNDDSDSASTMSNSSTYHNKPIENSETSLITKFIEDRNYLTPNIHIRRDSSSSTTSRKGINTNDRKRGSFSSSINKTDNTINSGYSTTNNRRIYKQDSVSNAKTLLTDLHNNAEAYKSYKSASLKELQKRGKNHFIKQKLSQDDITKRCLKLFKIESDIAAKKVEHRKMFSIKCDANTTEQIQKLEHLLKEETNEEQKNIRLTNEERKNIQKLQTELKDHLLNWTLDKEDIKDKAFRLYKKEREDAVKNLYNKRNHFKTSDWSKWTPRFQNIQKEKPVTMKGSKEKKVSFYDCIVDMIDNSLFIYKDALAKTPNWDERTPRFPEENSEEDNVVINCSNDKTTSMLNNEGHISDTSSNIEDSEVSSKCNSIDTDITSKISSSNSSMQTRRVTFPEVEFSMAKFPVLQNRRSTIPMDSKPATRRKRMVKNGMDFRSTCALPQISEKSEALANDSTNESIESADVIYPLNPDCCKWVAEINKQKGFDKGKLSHLKVKCHHPTKRTNHFT